MTEQNLPGAQVLLIHGAVSDSRIWDSVRAELPNDVPVIAPDLSYYGNSPWPDDGAGFGARAHTMDIEREAAAAGEPVHLVCLSMSCDAGIAAIVRKPELFRSAFFYEPGIVTHIADEKLVAELAADRRAAFLPVVEKHRAQGPQAAAVELVGERFALMSDEQRQLTLDNARTLRLIFGTAANNKVRIPASAMQSIKVPVCLATGTQTERMNSVPARAAAKLIPGAELIELEGANHFLANDDPARFASVLMEWLEMQRAAP